MLRVVAMRSSARAVATYFTQGEYYAADSDEIAGIWGGLGAERLELTGEVSKAVFESLCRNEHPETCEPLTPRTNQLRRVGYDFSFSVPKSVSVLFGLTEASQLREAFEGAVAETMQELDALAETRVRLNREQHERNTGNLLWASFTHTTARPVDGWPDPQLHRHVFVMNATWDKIENRCKAVDLAEIKKNAPYFEAAFQVRLSQRLRELGLDSAPTARGWEIAGIPEHVIRNFSRRTEQIEAKAKELGVTDAKEKDALGAKTRDHKRKDFTHEQIRKLSWSKLSEVDAQAVQAVVSRQVLLAPIDLNAAHRAVCYAIEHVFERQSVVPIRLLLTATLRLGIGQVSVDEVRQVLQASDLMFRERHGETFVTSREVLSEEQRLLAFARAGRGRCLALVPGDDKFTRHWLSKEQQAVLKQLFSSRDRVMLVRGAAGTGKTTMLSKFVEAISRQGHPHVILAPCADASRGVLRSEGFQSANTLAKFLIDARFQEQARSGVVIVDEAGLLGTRTMAKLFAVAESLGSRVVLLGDTRQHASVERGQALRLLETEAGLPVVGLTRVRRQTGRYKQAAELLSSGQILDGFDVLDYLCWVCESVGEDQERIVTAAVLQAIHDRKTFLVVSPTYAEGQRITQALRTALRESGRLAAEERCLLRYVSRGLTQAERGNPVQYHVGDVVEFHQNAPAFTKGSRYRVVKVGRSSIMVVDGAGRDRILPLRYVDRFEVYSVQELRVAVGDLLRVTKNGQGRGLRLNNGAVYSVSGFTASGEIVLGGGGLIRRDYAHLT